MLIKRVKVSTFHYTIAEWINAPTKKEYFTALHYASLYGNVKICKMLIDLGADINAKNKYGLNVLHVAC